MVIRIKKNGTWTNTIFWFLYFIMIALPLHASNSLLSYLSITGSVSIFHILIGALWIIVVAENFSHRLKPSSFLYMLFLASFIYVMIRGFLDSRHVFNNVIGDGVMYFLSIAILGILGSDIIKLRSLDELFCMTFRAMTVNLFLNTLMYATSFLSFWGVTAFNGGRLGGGYYSLLVVTVVYGLYDYLYVHKIKIWHLMLHIGLAVFCSILAQSRTHVILTVIGCAVLVLLKKNSKRAFKRAAVILCVGFVGVMLFLNSDNPLVERILRMDITSNTETTASRVITWKYYWNLIKDDPWGTGFGEIVYFINPSMTIAKATATYYIDNAIALVLHKGGWVFGFVYLYYVLKALVLLVKNFFADSNKTFVLMSVMLFAMLIFSIFVMTSQVIHTYATNVFMWTWIGTIVNSYRGKNKVDVVN